MNETSVNNQEPYREIQPFLRRDETLLWTGKPKEMPASQIPPFLPIFAIFWIGFAVFWTIMATAIGGPFGLFGVFFILIGGTLFYTLFFGQRKLLKTAVYAVTDRRAIILTRDRNGTNCTEYVFSALSSVNLEAVNGNTGTIRFAEDRVYVEYRSGWSRRRTVNSDAVRRSAVTAFFMIDDVHRVYRLITDQLEQNNQ
ncbi:MAG: hypothetical protein IKM00_07895 [Clostridia bacterium]|nr:hypothetical protein [Clostridia bacterium]